MEREWRGTGQLFNCIEIEALEQKYDRGGHYSLRAMDPPTGIILDQIWQREGTLEQVDQVSSGGAARWFIDRAPQHPIALIGKGSARSGPPGPL